MPTIAQFLIERLSSHVDHAFGVPGDYCLNFYDQLSDAIEVIGTTDEQCAGFAADAYARVKDFGCVCATYCVGGFKLMNSLAGAYAEKSPVLFISGSPGVKERDSEMMLHHMVGAFECQHQVLKNITCASAVLDDPTRAGYEIDRVISAIKQSKQPGYLELPRDMVDKHLRYDVYEQGNPKPRSSDPENLAEAIGSALEWLSRAKSPVILAGVEVARFGLGKELVKFAERANIPIACSFLGKSVVDERHPLFLGTYCGGMSEDFVRQVVEESDCCLMLGVMQTDMNLAFQPLKCKQTNVILANMDRCRIRRSTYERVNFVDFAVGIFKSEIGKKSCIDIPRREINKFEAVSSRPITASRLFEKINSILDEHSAIVADVGDSMFGAADLVVHHRNHFVAPAFYASMGFAMPAALGVQAACPDVRPIVILGDGSFQMTGMEFSSLVRRNYRPIVFVLNNGGYTTERLLLDGPFNDLQSWNYHRIPEVIGGGRGFLVNTEGELESAVSTAIQSDSASLIEIRVPKTDCTPALKRMMVNLAKQV